MEGRPLRRRRISRFCSLCENAFTDRQQACIATRDQDSPSASNTSSRLWEDVSEGCLSITYCHAMVLNTQNVSKQCTRIKRYSQKYVDRRKTLQHFFPFPFPADKGGWKRESEKLHQNTALCWSCADIIWSLPLRDHRPMRMKFIMEN